jgi:hypothetical protein
MKPPKQNVNIVQNEELPIERNVLAAAIVSMSKGVKQLSRGGLTLDAIIVLTQHNCRGPYTNKPKPTLAEVRAVLESLSDLERRFAKSV